MHIFKNKLRLIESLKKINMLRDNLGRLEGIMDSRIKEVKRLLSCNILFQRIRFKLNMFSKIIRSTCNSNSSSSRCNNSSSSNSSNWIS